MDPKQAGRCTACFLMEDECSPAQPTLKFKSTRYVWISYSWANHNAKKIDTFTTPFDKKKKKMQNVYSNLYSQAVTHPSTNRSQPCLTSVIGRELVYSRWYGRRHEIEDEILMQWSQMQKKAEGWVKSTQVDHIDEVRWCALIPSTNGF